MDEAATGGVFGVLSVTFTAASYSSVVVPVLTNSILCPVTIIGSSLSASAKYGIVTTVQNK